MTRSEITLAISIAFTVVVVALLLGMDARKRHLRETAPQPAPVQYAPLDTLEWRAPMPPQHSKEPLKVSL